MGTEKPGSPTKRFQCPSCQKSFAKPFSLKEHILIKHVQDAKSYPCDKCIGKNNLPKIFKTERTFKEHLHQVHGPRDRFKCHVCFKISTNPSNFRKHLLTHNQNIQKKFKCEFCSKTIGTKQHFHEHLFLVHKKKTPGVKYFKCELCSIECVSKFWLERHVVDKHVVNKEFKCTFCANKFIDQPTLDKHKKYHHTQNRLVCDVCSKGFKDKQVFMLHLEKKHLKFFYCSKCSRSFSDKSEFDQHLDSKSSSSELKFEFKCKICSSSFDSQCNLSIHTNCHLKETKLKKPNDELKSKVGGSKITNPPNCHLKEIKLENPDEAVIYEVESTTNPPKCHLKEIKLEKLDAEIKSEVELETTNPPEPKLTEASDTKKVFKCCSCESHFNSLRWLLEHRQRVHSDEFQAEKQTHTNIEFSDGVVYICSSSNCRFDTVSLKQVAIHYNEQHQLPKIVIQSLSVNGLKMENKSVNYPSSFTLKKYASNKTCKKKAERIIQRRYKCKICSRLFKRICDLTPHQETH